MKLSLREHTVSSVLLEEFGESLKSIKVPSSRGCINEVYCYETDKRRFFVKINQKQSAGAFSAEFQGLESLRATRTIRVPQPYCFGDFPGGGAYLIMEYIPMKRIGLEALEKLGSQLGGLHALKKENRFGFHMDNTIGGTPQRNDWSFDWVRFFSFHRLKHQLDLVDNILEDPAIRDSGNELLDILPKFFEGIEISPSLLHGDLWSGNVGMDEEGLPVVYDPAVYYGHSEAELSIMEMFGGFPERFYTAYRRFLPKQEGEEERVLLYKLYHYLNHLNLFGSSYYSQSLSIIKTLISIHK